MLNKGTRITICLNHGWGGGECNFAFHNGLKNTLNMQYLLQEKARQHAVEPIKISQNNCLLRTKVSHILLLSYSRLIFLFNKWFGKMPLFLILHLQYWFLNVMIWLNHDIMMSAIFEDQANARTFMDQSKPIYRKIKTLSSPDYLDVNMPYYIS